MKGYELEQKLHKDFCVSGTAGQPVVARDRETGRLYSIVDTEREVHEDADGSVTHWIILEEM